MAMRSSAGAKRKPKPKRSPAIAIGSFKMTLIWSETLPPIFEDAATQAPLGWITRRFSYIPILQGLVDLLSTPVLACGSTHSLGLNLPWEDPGHHFWRYYLEGKPLTYLRGMQAWRGLVPVWGQLEAMQTRAGDLVVPEFFFSPHGFGLILAVQVDRRLKLFDAVDGARKIARTETLSAKLPTELKPVNRTLPQFAEAAMSMLRSAAFGTTTAAGDTLSAEPFTIVTFLRGKGAGDHAVADGDDVHRALDGVTRWSATWAIDQLPGLTKNTVDSRRGPAAHLVYGRRSGRAVWFPSSFDEDGDMVKAAPRALHCYDRNLMFATAQTLALCGLAVSTSARLTPNRPLLPANEECAKLACGILGRLYGGTSTYRSGSVKSQIERHASQIDALRKHFSMPALHA